MKRWMLKNMNDGMHMQDDIGNSAHDGDGVHNGPNFFTGGQVNAFHLMMGSSQNDRKRRLKQTNVFSLLMQQQQQNNTQNNIVVDLRHELSIEVDEDDSFSDLSSSVSSFSINDSAPSSIEWLTDDEDEEYKPPSLHEILSARRARNVCKWKEMQSSELKNQCMLYELPYNGIKKNDMVASLMKLPLNAKKTIQKESQKARKRKIHMAKNMRYKSSGIRQNCLR